jgi:hypothetical protein
MPTALQTAISEYRGKAQLSDNYIADNLFEVRVAPLYYGELAPAIVQLVLNVGANELATGDVSINISANADITLYAGTSINFGDGIDGVVTVKTTTTLDSGVTGSVEIMPYQGTLVDTVVIAQIYNLTPLWSLDSGGLPDPQLTHATSENRQQGQRTYHQIIRSSDQVSMTGTLNLNDPSMDLISDAYFNKIFDVFVEATKPWYMSGTKNGVTYPAGQGFPSVRFSAPAKMAPTIEKDGLVKLMIEGPVNNKEEFFLLPVV